MIPLLFLHVVLYCLRCKQFNQTKLMFYLNDADDTSLKYNCFYRSNKSFDLDHLYKFGLRLRLGSRTNSLVKKKCFILAMTCFQGRIDPQYAVINRPRCGTKDSDDPFNFRRKFLDLKSEALSSFSLFFFFFNYNLLACLTISNCSTERLGFLINFQEKREPKENGSFS